MKKKVVITFPTKFLTKKVSGIIVGYVTRSAAYPNPQYGEAHYIGILLYFTPVYQTYTGTFTL
jgi:hypothetical protein